MTRDPNNFDVERATVLDNVISPMTTDLPPTGIIGRMCEGGGGDEV